MVALLELVLLKKGRDPCWRGGALQHLRCLQLLGLSATCVPASTPPFVAPALCFSTRPPRHTTPCHADKHLELMARLMGWVNAAIDMYRRTKAWVLSQGALALAILVLIVALLLRWLGWL